ncbi:MAG: AlbA family DNA-binding domain-containing protein, partial [Janthinobacterium lividum]
MRVHDLENWVLSILDRVEAKQPVEDVRVELKRDWPPDNKKAARRIAGHANAARGEPILWIIGVDEGAGRIIGADLSEAASWFNSVKANFDELAPEVTTLNVPVNGVTVVALYFETDRAPFVIKSPDGGAIQREVPWREATGVNSATRSQLIRLLSPLQKRPEIEVIATNFHIRCDNNTSREEWKTSFVAALYVVPGDEQQVAIPSFKSMVVLHLPGCSDKAIRLRPLFSQVNPASVSVTSTDILVKGPGTFEIRHNFSMAKEPELAFDAVMDVELTFGLARHDSPCMV